MLEKKTLRNEQMQKQTRKAKTTIVAKHQCQFFVGFFLKKKDAGKRLGLIRKTE
jgi:hypothetical protein